MFPIFSGFLIRKRVVSLKFIRAKHIMFLNIIVQMLHYKITVAMCYGMNRMIVIVIQVLHHSDDFSL